MRLHIIVCGIAALTVFAATAQTTQKLSATKANEYGLIYNLPQTVVDITLEAECEILKPGEFRQYAKIYLNTEPIMQESRKWTLKSAMIEPTSVADTREQWLVQFKAGSTPYIMVNEESIPLAINTEAPETTATPLPSPVAVEPTILDTPAARQVVTAEMAAATSTAKRAELAAAKIFELRETRNEILSGQSDNMPSDGAAMQLVLDNLANQEAALTAMFLGTRQHCTQVRTFRYVPGEEDERTVIARVSALDGIVEPTNLSGTPVYVDFKVTEKGKLPVNEKGEEKRFPKGGVAYRIPGKGEITVRYDRRNYAYLSLPLAQLGVTFGVDPALFTDKKAPAYLIFDPLTGGIRELGTISE